MTNANPLSHTVPDNETAVNSTFANQNCPACLCTELQHPELNSELSTDQNPTAGDFVITNRNRQTIKSVDDWRQLAPPKSPEHWQDNRSAKELARAWFRTGRATVPDEIAAILATVETFKTLVFLKGVAEYRSHFDDCGGEPSNIDLMLYGRTGRGNVVIGEEGKADEFFGSTIQSALRSAHKRPRTEFPMRLSYLVNGIFGSDPEGLSEMAYQLLSGVAGVLAEAQRYEAQCAVFIVHEFRSSCCSSRKLARNAEALNKFVSALGIPATIQPGQLYGPITVPGSKHIASIPLYLGKATVELPERNDAQERAV